MRQWRISIVFVLIIFLGAAIISRLVYVQIFKHDYYQALANGQQKEFQEISGERGEIFLNDNNKLRPIVINKEWTFCYVVPNEIKDKKETAQTLSQILSLDENFVFKKLEKEESFFKVIKKKITDDEINALKNANITGVYIKKELGRYYPLENFASQLLGFVGADGNGQYGVEGYYQNILKGESFFQEGEKGPFNYLLNFAQNKAKKGSDLVLTIDYNVQLKAEKLLEKAKDEFDIKEGAIMVLDPNSGKIFALANYPGFNPNEYSKENNLAVFENQIVQKTFEPGSVFKPITMAAALNEEKINPQTVYKDEGFVKIGPHTISNYHNKKWGERTMTEVLQFSINSGAIFAEKLIGDKTFLSYIEKFGFFEPTNIDLQGEVFSSNNVLKNGKEINFATTSFGQGIEITPVQLAVAFSAIANNGKLIQPYIVEKIIKDNGEEETKPTIKKEQIISQKTASQLTAMLIKVVENGSAQKAKIPGYYIAGKTGTAQVPWTALGIKKTGYSNETMQSFIGFAPAFNPRFLCLVVLNNPKTADASQSAVPIFKELAEYIINLWQIPPDYDVNEK